MSRQQVRCHGDERRFEAVAAFIYQRFGRSVNYIADVAGGQGLLSRVLNKRYNYRSEVIDPRGFTLKGVPSVKAEYTPDMAGFYDLIVGLHPDEALHPVVESAAVRPVVVVPCCNHWSPEKLGAKELINAVCGYLESRGVKTETVTLDFKGPKNIGIVTG
ncbi:MAG: hypothetical protein LBR76_06620 [Oscillospiraceae bacterium]|jgi:hypothetical protein|nr:hypothetical protein [Oscillospiraceae bacterium]